MYPEGPRIYVLYYISKVLIEIHKSWTDMLKSIMIPILLSCIVATDEIRRVKHVSLFKCAQKAYGKIKSIHSFSEWGFEVLK